MTAAQVTWVIEDARGYGPAVVERLRHALENSAVVSPDPRHPHMFVVEAAKESFYVAPLSAGKLMLVAYWEN